MTTSLENEITQIQDWWESVFKINVCIAIESLTRFRWIVAVQVHLISSLRVQVVCRDIKKQ